MHINKIIQQLLDSKIEVYSRVMGRFGKVMEITGPFVRIKKCGVTRFDMGDPIELTYKNDKVFIFNRE